VFVSPRFEHRRKAEGDDQHADHLHHRQEPVAPVVHVVRRREPREVDPGPRDGEARVEKAADPGADVPGGERVRQLAGGDSVRDDERQIEQQLERRRHAMRLVWVAPAHDAGVVMELLLRVAHVGAAPRGCMAPIVSRLRYARRMAPRRGLGCLGVAAIAALALMACKDDSKFDPRSRGKKGGGEASALDGDRCEQMAKACSDEKHVSKLAEECSKAGVKLGQRGCTLSAATLYECYETKLCGKADKVWTLDDLRVLAERHEVCKSEREALRECVSK
jgi:hypothetical protein